MNRDFKGLWIPREIWEHESLSWVDKCLWAVIENGAANASNVELAQFLNVKPQTIARSLTHLKKLNLINSEVSLPTRQLKAILPTEESSNV